MKKLKQLKVLELNDGNLKALPAALGSLTNLEEIRALGNDLVSFPNGVFSSLASIGKLAVLELAKVDGDPAWESLPADICSYFAGGGLTTNPWSPGGTQPLSDVCEA